MGTLPDSQRRWTGGKYLKGGESGMEWGGVG